MKPIVLYALLGVGLYALLNKKANAYAPEISYENEMPQPLDENMTDTIPTKLPRNGMTRGERNNNPGNIVKSNAQWHGLSTDQSKDARFAQFDSPEYGIRAIAKLLQGYAAKGYDTVQAIISKYAPSSENDTYAYINAVSKQIGLPANTPLDLNDPETLTALVAAIITHENGRLIYSDAQLAQGISMV